MKILRIVFLSILLVWRAAKVAASLSPDAVTLAHWIADRQFHNAALPGYGAIAGADGPAAIGDDGRQYYSVSPYSANLAVIALLKSRMPNALSVAEPWAGWYFAHLNRQSAPDGVPYNHFYRADGSGETTCVKPGNTFLCHYNDATDSAAATFLSVLWAAHEAGLPDAFLKASPRQQQVETLANLILKLQQPDGLCAAKRDYRVRYLEDNSEVFAGLCAAASLEKDVFENPQRSETYKKAAENVRRGILVELYDKNVGLFCVAKFENNDLPAPNLHTWYPDSQAQLWPVLFGVISAHDPRALTAAAGVNDHWNGKDQPDWARDPSRVNQGWVEAGHACAALLMGETNRVKTYINAVNRFKIADPGSHPRFRSPFTVDDAGWLLRILATGCH